MNWMRLVFVFAHFYCLLCGKLVHGFPRNVFRTGAALSNSGQFKEMADAWRGYEFGVEVINKLNKGKGFSLKDVTGFEYFFKFSFDARDDGSNNERHLDLVKSLLKGKEPVDFLFGSHPEFASNETEYSNQHERINLQCCVGPDKIYEQNLQYVFGIPVSNEKYTELTIQSMRLRGIKRVAVIYNSDNLFTSTTCTAALDHVQELDNVEEKVMTVDVLHKYSEKQSTDPKVFAEFVQDCIDKRIEAVVACSFGDDGKLLVETFHSARSVTLYPLVTLVT